MNLIATIIIIPQTAVGDPGLEERQEPVVVTGSDIPDLQGKPVNEIWIYAYESGNWVQIPFQIDERNDANGSYFFDAGDGLLDGNDEMVFMPFDCGDEAPGSSRVPNTDSKRYRIELTDPIDSSVKYAYIYSSSLLTKTFTDDYVDYNMVLESIGSSDYTIGFNDTNSGVIDHLSVSTQAGGDSNDILDRFKYRFQKTIVIFPEQYNEDNLTVQKIGVVDGAVRVISKMRRNLVTDDFTITLDDTIFAYRSYFNTIHGMSSNTSTDWVEITMDFLGSSTPLTYYDSNANTITMDGSPETPGNTDAPLWYEITGSFGTIVAICNYSQIGVTPSISYLDDLSLPDAPEFEPGVYGKNGLQIPSPSVGYQVDYSYYLLGSNQGNIGEECLNLSQQAVLVGTFLEIIDPSSPPDITDAQEVSDPQEVNGPVNISVQVKDSLNEVLSVHIQVFTPLGSELGNYTMSYLGFADRYYFRQLYSEIGTFDYTIWAVDFDDNWNSLSGDFELVDTTSSKISHITAIPSQQVVGGEVNITVKITDSVSVFGAWIIIENPFGSPLGNFSMDLDQTEERYFYKEGYIDVGVYSFTIFTNDTSDNWNSSQGQFEIMDSLAPEADAGPDRAINTNTIVQFNGTGSTDNVGITNYSWTFTDGTIKTLYGPNPSYRFENVGNFRVTLNVRDAKGNFREDMVWINVTELITTGSISGIVTDSDGTPIAGATVSVEGTSFSGTTDGTGSYLIENVPAGNYNIVVSREKYKDKVVSNVLVIAGETTSNDPVTMSKTETLTPDGSSSLVLILLVIVIIAIMLVIFLMTRTRKETEIVEEVIEEVNFLCPECGTMVSYDMKRCPGCGVEFGDRDGEVEEPKESPADIYMCPSCGSFVSSHAIACEKCGFVFDEDQKPQKKDDENVEIPEGFLGGGSRSQDGNKGAKKEYDGVNIPAEITERVAKQVEELMNENGFEIEETELELEVELDGDLSSEEKKRETREILDLFKNEFNSVDSGKDQETLTKEIDDILRRSKNEIEEGDVEITDDDEK